ncbi:MAG TPA: hypothetical protein VN957_24545 [Chthoniobacterales bacterium]|nr:hypothetical protein [Chthoniobacterales bacterium]
MNRFGSSISRELKATQEDGRFYVQRSSCSIEITYDSEREIDIAIEWHTGARLLGHGSKSWRTHSLKEAAHQLHQFVPNANVPYRICVAELVAHLPAAGKTIAFDPTRQTKMLPDGTHDQPTDT